MVPLGSTKASWIDMFLPEDENLDLVGFCFFDDLAAIPPI